VEEKAPSCHTKSIDTLMKITQVKVKVTQNKLHGWIHLTIPPTVSPLYPPSHPPLFSLSPFRVNMFCIFSRLTILKNVMLNYIHVQYLCYVDLVPSLLCQQYVDVRLIFIVESTLMYN
jgi:hypothetical protein